MRTTAESTFGGGVNAPGRHAQRERHRETVLKHYRKPAVRGRGGLGNHALDDLLLQHEDAIDEVFGDVGHAEEKRGGHVVGQIADNA
jgi:hypothetical protein